MRTFFMVLFTFWAAVAGAIGASVAGSMLGMGVLTIWMTYMDAAALMALSVPYIAIAGAIAASVGFLKALDT